MLWRRSIVLALTLVAVYLLWPSLLTVFSAWPDLLHLDARWFGVMAAVQAMSFACMWQLLRVTLRVEGWLPVVTSQLASNAVSRIVPGGVAAGPALQFRMLNQAGVPGARIASGVTATSVMGLATLLALPALAIPVAVLEGPIPSGLAQAALLGGGVFLVLFLVTAVGLTTDRPLEWVGAVLQWLGNRYRPDALATDIPENLLRERDDLRSMVGSIWWKAVLYATAVSLFDYQALLAALAAVGSTPRPTLVLLAYVAARLLSLIPVTPGGLGFVEVGLAGVLVLAKVDSADAVLATLAYRLVSFWLPLPLGLVAYVCHHRRYAARATSA